MNQIFDFMYRRMFSVPDVYATSSTEILYKNYCTQSIIIRKTLVTC